MNRSQARTYLITSIIYIAAISAQAQEQAQEPVYVLPLDVPAITARWAQMPNSAFVKEVLDTYEPERRKWDRDVRDAYGKAADTEAARRLRQNTPYTADELPYLAKLVEIADTALTPVERLSIRERLANQLRANNAASIAELQAVFDAQSGGDSALADRVSLIKDWVGKHDVSDLSVEDFSWLVHNLGRVWGYQNRSMQVRWTGDIRAPQDGQYTFSACRTQIHIDRGRRQIQESTKVYIDNQLVLEASAAKVTSKPVSLSSTQPSSIRVEYDHKHNGFRPSATFPASVMLLWQGPGISKQLVPSSALTPPQGKGSGAGLWGEYASIQPNNSSDNPVAPITALGVDRQIDFLWTNGYSFLLRDRSTLDPVVAELVKKMTGPEFHAELRESFRPQKASSWSGNAEMMTSLQRAACLRALADDAEILRRMSPMTLLRVIRAFRVGAENDAITLIGNWAQVYTDDPPRANENFYVVNRETLFDIADHLTYDMEDGCVRLENDYLALPDGSCNLPAAYIIAYNRAFRGDLDAWINNLDGRLAHQNLTGDQRASWLIARAQAEEIRGNTGPHLRFTTFPERYHAGWEFLDEASLVAEGEPVRLRVFIEKLARTVSIRPNEVSEMLQGAKQNLTAPDSVTQLTELEEFLQEHSRVVLAKEERQQKARDSHYLQRLEQRKERAIKNNDTAAAARLSQIIDATESNSSPNP